MKFHWDENGKWGHPLKDTLSRKKYSLSKKDVNFFLKADGIC